MLYGEHSMKHRKGLFIVVTITAVALLTSAVTYTMVSRSRQSWRDLHPLSNSRVGFQFLVPTQLPNGFHITGKWINIEHGASGALRSVSVEMNLRAEDGVYDIQESQATNEDTSTSLRNFNPMSVSPTCTSKESLKGKQYRLCHWVDYGKISVYEVEVIIQGVYIHTSFPTTRDHVISDEELGAFVDSFVPSDPGGIPISADTV
jgi:hypothetical protein